MAKNDREIGELTGKVNTLIGFALAIVAILLALAGGGFGLYGQIGDLKSDIAVIKQDIVSIKANIQAIASKVTASGPDPEMQAALKRIEARLASANPASPGVLDLSSPDMKLVSTLLAEPVKAFTPLLAQEFPLIGEFVKTAKADAIPDDVWKQLPKLKGLRFTVDARRNIVILASQTDRVLAVIPAN